jgi:uncharacterized LabA/DUF88 family protein
MPGGSFRDTRSILPPFDFPFDMGLFQEQGARTMNHVPITFGDARKTLAVPSPAQVFIDGQNFFKALEAAWSRSYSDYDPMLLARLLATRLNCDMPDVHFYTGLPSAEYHPRLNDFWLRKADLMERDGVNVTLRPLRYMRGPDGRIGAREKGIDTRMSLDMLKVSAKPGVAKIIILSLDQDLCEAVSDIHALAAEQGRKMDITTVFPEFPPQKGRFCRPIRGTRAFTLRERDYYLCRDQRVAPRKASEFACPALSPAEPTEAEPPEVGLEP